LASRHRKISGDRTARSRANSAATSTARSSPPGSIIYLPVWNEGALFSTGDGHAVQGDGEVDGTAIETALTGTFEFHVRKDLRWRLPRAETAAHLITFGLDADLDDAARQALHEMIDWIAGLTGIGRDEAYALTSIAADLHVTQTVNFIKGVHAMIDKSILRRPG
jgi:acetamidase/formamidase